jgi:L-threonylcarbamoyladenylate synthase
LSGTGDVLARAVAVLRAGGLVALPTETVYGLAVDAENELAVRRLFAVKGRPVDHPVIVHLADGDALSAWARAVPPAARALAEAFWPGPLTLVLPRTGRAHDLVTGAPSANRFGRVSPTTADHVVDDLGPDVDLVLDGGPCAVGIESTIVDLAGDPEVPRILRSGAITRDDVARVTGRRVRMAGGAGGGGGVRAPGMLAAHYAPRAGVELVSAEEAGPRAQALGGRRVVLVAPPDVPAPALTLARRIDAPSDPDGFARRLYAMLREADARGAEVALVVPPAASGAGEAVRDRLRRAAAGGGGGAGG